MFSRKPKQQKVKKNETEILSNSQMQQLKQAFSDISLSSKGSEGSQQFILNNVDKQMHESSFSKMYGRIKNTFYDLNSRSFVKYSQFSSYLQLGKIIQTRPDLLKINITVNSLEVLAVLMAFFIPKKYVNKTLVTLFTLTIQIQFIQKLMLNYYIEQIALKNNRMEPVQQQARNLIEYKYRIHNINDENENQQQKDPYVKQLLQQVTKKNIEYIKFKKVQLLL